MRTFLRRRARTIVIPTLLSAALVTAGLAGVATAAPAGPISPATGAMTDPIYNYANAVRESVWVDTGIPDPNGGTTRVAADIIRPKEAADKGIKVPVIMDASPYYQCCGRGNESQKKAYDANGNPISFPLFYDNYFVPRGYSIVQVDLSGTSRSNGCEDVGGKYEIASAKSVIDWLNGRATGYASPTSTTTKKADWSNGSVGMIGKSWDGTIANGVASTGVDGLKTIVPIAAISSWYDYYRANGAVETSGSPDGLASYVMNDTAKTSCQQTTQKELKEGALPNGNYTPMWQSRDFTLNASKVKASVFVVHGVNDLNVKTIHFGQWWPKLNVEKKIWLSQTGHVDPFDFRRTTWVPTLHKWFDHYLMGIDNGIQNEPQASIERAPDQWADEAKWAADSVTPTTLSATNGSAPGVGKLGTAAPTPGSTASFVDDPSLNEAAWAANAGQVSKNRVIYSTGALAKDVRVSGTSSITITATPKTLKEARLSAVLVDYGPQTIRNYMAGGEGITTLTTRSCFGDSIATDSACYKDTKANVANVDYDVISRGWADLGHYKSLTSREELTAGQPYTITFNLHTTDRLIKAGHQLALIIAGTDADWITPVNGRPELTLDLTKTSIKVPLIGELVSSGTEAPVGTRGLPRELSTLDVDTQARFR